MRIEKALERFVTQLEADGRSVYTIGQYRRHVQLFARWAHDARPRCAAIERVSHEDVAAFLASPAATSCAGSTVAKKASSSNCLRTSLRVFLAHCHRAGYARQDAGRLVRLARCAPPPPRGLDERDAQRLLSVLSKAKDAAARRDHAMILLMLRTGLRVGSVVALRVEDLDLPHGTLEVHRVKGGTPLRVYLPRDVKACLRRFIGRRRTGALFCGPCGEQITTRHVQRLVVRWCQRAGIAQKVSPHCLRHAYAMQLYRASGDVLLVQAALGHRSIASTLTYARVDGERLRQAAR